MGKTEEQVRDDWHEYHSMQGGDAAFDNRDIDILRRQQEVSVQRVENGVQMKPSSTATTGSSTPSTSPSLVDRPKSLEQGIAHGISHFVEGAMDAAGVAVSATKSGRAAGSKHGIAGQVVGMTGGAMVGALGATAVAMGGVIQGTTAIARGVAAVPDSINQPKMGKKWWNENEGQWMESNLDTHRRPLEDGTVPPDDSDLLPPRPNETTTPTADPRVTVTGSYYHLLGVERTATVAEIRRQYYLLARRYHPDRVVVATPEQGGGDASQAAAAAADRFRAVSEAYQVLSDESLRSQYDQNGHSTSPNDAFDKVPKIDPLLLYSHLFGSDKFQEYVGRLAIATNALLEEHHHNLATNSSSLSLTESRRVLQERRCIRLAIQLADRLEAWVQNDQEFALAAWISTMTDLREAAHGPELLQLIGKNYLDNAIFFLGSRDAGIGTPGFVKWKEAHYAEMMRKRHLRRARLQSAQANVHMHQVATRNVADEMDLNEADEQVAQALLQVMWTSNVLDITTTLHETCQRVLFDTAVSDEVRKKRGLALKALGDVFWTGGGGDGTSSTTMQQPQGEPTTFIKTKSFATDQLSPASPTLGGAPPASAIDLYEEAAFHAITETIKRREEEERQEREQEAV